MPTTELPQTTLAKPLTLANGVTLRNRLAKSAMSEGLGTAENRPREGLATLYGRWADGGLGLCITGNAMVDRRALGEPNNVALEDDRDMDVLQRWAAAGTRGGTQLWMQLNHPGKQTPRGLSREAVAPSAIPFRKDLQAFFVTPRAMTETEIEETAVRFGVSAGLAKRAGFSGVQIHGAHGYLVSQFLSPHHNQRTDQWGGTPDNRRRFVLTVLREMRRAVGAGFPIGIKMNSADFQTGGLAEEEALGTVQALAEAGIDMIEISGGTYEAPAMMLGQKRESTRRREAFFLAFAEMARAAVKVPLMLTGGFRTLAGMHEAVAGGAVDIVGLGRSLTVEPDLPLRLLRGEEALHPIRPITTGIAAIDKKAMMETLWYQRQIHRMAAGREPDPAESGLKALLAGTVAGGWSILQSRRYRA